MFSILRMYFTCAYTHTRAHTQINKFTYFKRWEERVLTYQVCKILKLLLANGLLFYIFQTFKSRIIIM